MDESGGDRRGGEDMSDARTPAVAGWERSLLDEVSSDELWRHTETLAGWERISGTPGEQAAIDYLRARLEDYGVETTRYEFDSLLGWPEAAELEVRVPRRSSLPCITHAYAPSTPGEGLEGDLVYVGAGEDADFAGAGAAGKVALVEGMPSPSSVLRGRRRSLA